MNDLDSERYTAAMLALGYAHGLVLAMRREIPVTCQRDFASDVAWLEKRVAHVLSLNEASDRAAYIAAKK